MSFVREKKIYCGDKYLEVDIYTCFEKRIKNGKRSKKKKESLLSQKNNNDKNARRKLIQLTEANFKESDYHVSLTYNQNNYPETLEEAEREMKNYIRRLDYKYKKENKELKYIVITSYNKENYISDNEEPVRTHHHLIINGEIDRDIVEDLWSKGRGKKRRKIGYANVDRLQPDTNTGLSAIATYLVRQPSNKRKWSCSLNLKRPESRTNDYKYTRRKLLRLIGHNKDLRYWEREYPGWRIQDKDNGYIEKFNEVNGTWNIYLKLRKIE